MAFNGAVMTIARCGEECAEQFRSVAVMLEQPRAEVQFADLWSRWNEYYQGIFFRFDALLREDVLGSGESFEPFYPLSVAHHNVHRLLEVLGPEIGMGTLDTARVPERVDDLIESSILLQCNHSNMSGFHHP
jgi:hypothetical protein